MASDGLGGTIVAWADARNADIYAQRFDASGQALWRENGINVSDMPGTQKFARVVADGLGGAFVVFESDTSTGWICHAGSWFSVVVVARLDASGAVQWKKRISDGASTSYRIEARERAPLAAPDGSGGAIVAWTTDHEFYADPLCTDPPDCCSWFARNNYAQRIDAAGNLLWGTTPVVVCADDEYPEGLAMSVDSSGAAYLAWCDRKPYYTALYVSAQKLDAAGNALWGPTGVKAAPYTSWQETPAIACDLAGGVVVAWKEGYGDGKMFAQRLDSLGAPVWAPQGILLTATAGARRNVGIVSTGRGASIIAWIDGSTGVPALCAQRVDAAGLQRWQWTGIRISDGVNTCAAARVAPDGENGAVFAWEQSPPESGLSLRGIWGFSPSAIYSVGDGGMILRYNGVSWNRMNSGTTASLRGVWGSATNDVYAVGAGGLILHYDGASWSPMTSGVTADLNDVWGISSDTIYAVGAGSAIVRYDGSVWNLESCPTCYGANLMGAHGNGSRYVWAVGEGDFNLGVLIHYHGTNWHCVYCAYANYYGVWVSPDSCVYAGGARDLQYAFFARYDKASWFNTPLTVKSTVRGMWGDRSDNVYAVLDNGNVARFDGSGWTLAPATTAQLLDVWGTAGSDLWVVGKEYLIRHFEDGEWITQYRAGTDVMVQRVDTLGAKMWTGVGAPVSVDIDAQTAPSLAYGPPGLAILAWTDNRNGNWDIYARGVSIARGPTVATELQSFDVRPASEGLRVSWRLSRCDDDAAFEAARSDHGGVWHGIDAAVEKNGLAFFLLDRAVEPGGSYRYRIDVSDSKGTRILFATGDVSVPVPPLALHQNVPNPFNPATSIRYTLPARCRVSLAVFDVSGRLVARLVDGEKPAGVHIARWAGADESGSAVSSGIYLCRLRAGKESRTIKLVLLR